MAKAFNLTAEINLRGPSNLKPVISKIKGAFSSLTADVKINVDASSAKNMAAVSSKLNLVSKASNKANASFKTLNSTISTLSASFGQLSTSMSSAFGAIGGGSQQLTKAKKELVEVTAEIEYFGQQSGQAIRRFAAFSTVTAVIYGLNNAINDAFGEFISFNKQLVKLSQVTGKSLNDLGGLTDEITRLSTSLGVSSTELIGVASTLAQAGFTAADTRKALEALAKSSLAPSFENITETTEGAIAILRQFGLGAEDLESALGSINAVAAAFAVESQDLVSAIQRTGGVFANASKGVSNGTDALNEFLAIFTSIRATTRESAETIATGLRTIFTRLQRSRTIDLLKELGINLTDLEGKFVGPYKAVQLLSEGLSQLDPRDIRFSQIVEELGGFRQIGKVIPLIQQFATAEQALKVAQSGQASLTRDSITAQLSFANQLSKTRESFLALVREIGDSTTFNAFIQGSIVLTDSLIALTRAVEPLLPLLATFATIKLGSLGSQFLSGFLGPGGLKPNLPKKNSGGPILGFANGGLVPGYGNKDSIPAMLTPGEMVLPKSFVQKAGLARGGRPKKLKTEDFAQGIANAKNSELSPNSILNQSAVGVAMLKNPSGKASQAFFESSTISKKSIIQSVGSKYSNLLQDSLVGGLAVKKQSLSPSAYATFDSAIEEGLVQAVNSAVAAVGQKFPNLPVPAISDTTKQKYLAGVNDAAKGNLFEEILTSMKNKGIYEDNPDPQRPFDFSDGLGDSAELFPSLKDLRFVDAKASNPSNDNIAKKIANQTLKDIGVYSGRKNNAITTDPSLIDLSKLKPGTEYTAQEIIKLTGGTPKSLGKNLKYKNLGSGRLYSLRANGGIIQKFAEGGSPEEELVTRNYRQYKVSDVIQAIKEITGSSVNSDVAKQMFMERITPSDGGFAYYKYLDRPVLQNETGAVQLPKWFSHYTPAPTTGSWVTQERVTAEMKARRLGLDPYQKLSQSTPRYGKKQGYNIGGSVSEYTVFDGLIRKFEDAGDVTATSGKPISRSDIIKILGVNNAAKAAGIRASDVYQLLGVRNPNDSQKAMREAIEKEYLKKINRQVGATKGTATRIQNRGLEFGAAGLLGSASAPKNIQIDSDRLKRSATVRVISGVMDQNIAQRLDDLFTKEIESITSRAAQMVDPNASGQVIPNFNAEAAIQGGLLEKVVQKLGGPGAIKGQGFDFPNGLGRAASYFGLPDDIPTDLKRTLSGPSTIKDNIVTYLKNVMGYAGGGSVRVINDRASTDDTTALDEGLTDIVNKVSRQFGKKGRPSNIDPKSFGGYGSIKGAVFEEALRLSGAGEAESSGNADWDYDPWKGNVAFTKLDSAQIVDAKATKTAANRTEMLKKVSNYSRKHPDENLSKTTFGAAIFEDQSAGGDPEDYTYSMQEVRNFQKKNLGGIIQKFAQGGKIGTGGLVQKFMDGSPGGVSVSEEPELVTRNNRQYKVSDIIQAIKEVTGKSVSADIAKHMFMERITPSDGGFAYYKYLDRAVLESETGAVQLPKWFSRYTPPPQTGSWSTQERVTAEMKARRLGLDPYQKLAPSRPRYGKKQRYNSGGSVPALVSNGEAYIPPTLAKKIGYATLNKMNHADKNGMGKFANGGISVFKGPGTGTSDSIPTSLPIGSFILRQKATKALGFNQGGSVRKFAAGGVGTPGPSLGGTIPSNSVLQKELEKLTKNIADVTDSLDKFLSSIKPELPKFIDSIKASSASINKVMADLSSAPSSTKSHRKRKGTGSTPPTEPPADALAAGGDSGKPPENTEARKSFTDSIGGMTGVVLAFTTVVRPQLEKFASTLVDVNSVMGKTLSEGFQQASSLGFSAGLALQAAGASQGVVKTGQAVGVGVGAIAGTISGFSTKTLENTINNVNTSFKTFDKALKDSTEAATASLRIEAASKLDIEFTKLIANIGRYNKEIQNTSNLKELGTLVDNVGQSLLTFGTIAIAASQAQSSASAATTAASAAGIVASTGLFTKFAGFIPVVGQAIAIVGTLASVGYSLYSYFSNINKVSSDVIKNFEQLADATANQINSGNDFSTSNERYVALVAEASKKLRETSGPSQQRNRQEQFGTLTNNGQINELNFLFDQTYRDVLRSRGFLIQFNESTKDFISSLDDQGKQRAKELQDQATTTFRSNALIKQIRATEPQSTTEAQITAKFNKLIGAKAGTQEAQERERLIQEFATNFNVAKASTDSLALSQKTLAIQNYKLIDVLNRFDSVVSLSTNKLNASFDNLNSYVDDLLGQGKVRPDTTARDIIENLKNLTAISANELQQSIDKAFDMTGISGDIADAMRTSITGMQAIEKELPVLIRNVRSRGLGPDTGRQALETDLENLLKPTFDKLPQQQGNQVTGFSTKEIQNNIIREVADAIQKTNEDRTLDIEQFTARIQEQIPKVLEIVGGPKSREGLIKVLEAADNKLQKLAQTAQRLSEVFQQSTQLQIKRDNLISQTRIDISRATGQPIELQQLNESFNNTINRLTKNIGMNPELIGQALAQKITEARTQSLQNPEDIRGAGQLTAEINDLQSALQLISSSNERLKNSIDNLTKVNQKMTQEADIYEAINEALATGNIAEFAKLNELPKIFERVRANPTSATPFELSRAFEYLRRAPMSEEEKRAAKLNIIRERETISALDSLAKGEWVKALMSAITGSRFSTTQEDLNRLNPATSPESNPVSTVLTNLGFDMSGLLGSLAETVSAIETVNKERDLALSATKSLEANVELAIDALSKGIDVTNKTGAVLDQTTSIWSNFNNNISGVLDRIVDDFDTIGKKFAVTKDTAKVGQLPVTARTDAIFGTIERLPNNLKKSLNLENINKNFYRSGNMATLGPVTQDAVNKLQDRMNKNARDIEFLTKHFDDPIAAGLANLQKENAILNTTIQELTNALKQPVQPTKPIYTPILGPQGLQGLNGPQGQMGESGSILPSPPPMAPPVPETPTVNRSNNTQTINANINLFEFLDKFKTTFGTNIDRFDNTVTNLGQTFGLLSIPINKFSESVNTLISGLNEFNNKGGIKGPNIPEKATVTVSFDENLIVEAIGGNNNRLLEQVGQITKQQIETAIKDAFKFKG